MFPPVAEDIVTRFEVPDPEPPQQRQEPDSRPSPGPARNRGGDDDPLAAIRRENEELRQSNRSLMDIVGRVTPKPAAPASQPVADDEIDWNDEQNAKDEDAPLDEDPAALIDEISKNGFQALAKRGFVRKSEVRQIAREESRRAAVTASRQVVGKARAEATTESTILSEFPELSDQTSDLFKATIPIVNRAVRFNPKAAQDPATLYMAATAARAQLDAKKGDRRSSVEEEDDDREPVRRAAPRSRDDDRDEHIRAQSGDRSRSRSRMESGDGEFQMSADAKKVAQALGLTDAEYTAEAKKGYKPVDTRGRR